MDDFVTTLRDRLSSGEHIHLGDPTSRQLHCGKAAVRIDSTKNGDRRAAVAVVLRQNNKGGSLELLLIKRAENPRDRWSGDVALPGGRQNAGETDIETAIRETREEVGLDLSGGGYDFLGQLDDRLACQSAGRRLILSSFIFLGRPKERKTTDKVSDSESGAAWRPFKLQEKEIAHAWWTDISLLLSTPAGFKTVPIVRSIPAIERNSFILYLVTWLGLDQVSLPGVQLTPPVRYSVGKGSGAARGREGCSGSDTSSGGHEEDFVLWGLTLGVVTDMAEAARQPLAFGALTDRQSATSFRFRKAHWIVDGGARTAHSLATLGWSQKITFGLGVAVAALAVSFWV